MAESQYLDIHKYLMIYTGKWFVGFKNRKINFLYKIFSFFSEYFMVVMAQLILLSIFIYRNCQESRLPELFCYYVQYTNSFTSSFLSKRQDMKNVFKYIMDYESVKLKTEQSSSIPIYFKYARLNRIITLCFAAATVFTGVFWYILVVQGTMSIEGNDFCSLKRGINYQLWYPFNAYDKFYFLILFIDVALLTSVAIYHIYNRATVILILIFVLAQLKILQNMIRHADENVAKLMKLERISSDEATFIVFRDCARKHQEIIRLMQLIDTACRGIVLIGFFSNSFELAVFLIKLITDTSILGMVRTLFVLLLETSQIFLFFWYANEIQVESITIADVIYNETDWLKYNVKTRKHLMLMIIRSKKPLTCKAAAIGDMSIDTFKRIIKLCYSITTFFKTVYG